MATEVSAKDKHACPACGAQAEWDPGKQKLVCSFCGTESPYAIDRETGKITELDLVTALRDLPDDERGWIAARRSVRPGRQNPGRAGQGGLGYVKCRLP
jgi:hypothetical protein